MALIPFSALCNNIGAAVVCTAIYKGNLRFNSARSLTWLVPLSCTVIIPQRHAVCFAPFLAACLRLVIQISGVHPDLCWTKPLIQPFSSCHHLVNWAYPSVSSWHNAHTVMGVFGVPGLYLLACVFHYDRWYRYLSTNLDRSHLENLLIIFNHFRFSCVWSCLLFLTVLFLFHRNIYSSSRTYAHSISHHVVAVHNHL